MTVKEQIFIEDEYRKLKTDLDKIIKQIEDPHEDGWDFNEMDDLLDMVQDIYDLLHFIDNFIYFAGYEWRELEKGWTLFEREEEGA